MQRHWLIVLLLVLGGVLAGGAVGVARLVRFVPIEVFAIKSVLMNDVDASDDYYKLVDTFTVIEDEDTFTHLNNIVDHNKVLRGWMNSAGTRYLVLMKQNDTGKYFFSFRIQKGDDLFSVAVTGGEKSHVKSYSTYESGSDVYTIEFDNAVAEFLPE